MAAIAAARTARSLGAALDVVVHEAGERVGRKILVSGNGRCNLSNTGVAPGDYNDPAFVAPTLDAYGYAEIVEFFAGIGLTTYVDDEGRTYPSSNTASAVLNVLRLEIDHLGVDVRTGSAVESVASLRTDDPAPAVVVATGGGTTLLAGCGHTTSDFTPVVGPIRTDTEPIRGLSGVRVRCGARVFAPGASEPGDSEVGELLFRDYGVSGVMVFDLSRYIVRGSTLEIDFVPDQDEPALESALAARAASLSWRSAEGFFEGMLHPRVAGAVLRAANISAACPVPEMPVGALARALKHFTLSVLGPGDPAQAQVTRGGVRTSEIDPVTLESRVTPGVFVAGEVLDIDGRCGGYNLHWAWASGLVAGERAARWALEHSTPASAVPAAPAAQTAG